ncbi:MAG: DegT/DnrJ/EryC1/StrS family aminotransferase, partial [Prochlorococcaceae cyanobacterium]
VSTIIYYPIPIHRQPAYAGLGGGAGSLPVTEALASQVLSLPIFPELSASQQDAVIAALRQLLAPPAAPPAPPFAAAQLLGRAA